ncbi:YIP1 family protein [Paenibacillus terrigena]|uniref:YIP1 family protein n=1 Tax=Paenibacillus terrigena TaxID=369333 RepID=UPI00036EAA68|nr:YIP1 family protein [Paenibacillus terrigena]
MKRILALLFAMTLFAGYAIPAAQAAPDETYNYNYWGQTVPAPSPYEEQQVMYGRDWGVKDLSSPQDVYVGSNRHIYIADTGNDRIIVLNDKFEAARIISEFEHDGKKDTFNKPEGVFYNRYDDHLFIADTQNKRIVELNEKGEFIRQIGDPKSTLIRQGFQYSPIKVIVDKAQRIYVISRGSYEGIMEFDTDGGFNGFIGTNRVKFSPVDLFWKRISTKSQREQMQLFIPLEFNNMDIDADGFIYTTTSEEKSDQPIKRLNASGVDILRDKGYFPPKGDIHTLDIGSAPGSSIFVDVVSDEGGIYNALDSKRGRIFTYDKDGNLLYVFGGLGSKQGKFRTPSAIAMLDDKLLVLDKDYNRLSLFQPTHYGSLIREAVISLYNGQAEKSTAAWQKVLQLNGNLEVAYIGIGKSLLKNGDNHGAMKYFELGNNRENYSEAFKRYRKEIVFEYFGMIVLTIALVIGGSIAAMKLAGRRKAQQHYVDVGSVKSPFYTMVHPFNGFWEMKYEKKGKLKIVLIMVALLVLFTIIKRQYSGFVVNFNNPNELNSINELKFIILPFILWCVANWSLTTLMDGEGKFKDIVMATGYALMPFIIIYLPQTLYSNLITGSESSFYYILDAIALIWFIWLLFVGTMTVHQYSASKTVVTMLLTLVVIGIMVFLGVLFFSMLQQMANFIISIYRELSFRF